MIFLCSSIDVLLSHNFYIKTILLTNNFYGKKNYLLLLVFISILVFIYYNVL